jgi:hypothetical protein
VTGLGVVVTKIRHAATTARRFDCCDFGTATATATTATAITTITAIITPTISAPDTTLDSHSHAGIALVTVGAVVLLVAAVIAFLFLYRNILLKRRRDKTTSQREPVELDESMRKSEMPVDSGNLPAHELIGDRAEPVELHSQMTVE